MKTLDIARKHPNYYKYLDDWLFYKASYDGGKEYTMNTKYKDVSMLEQHDRENNYNFIERRRRSIYLNYCKFVVDTYAKFIFSGKNSIIRLIEPENDIFYSIIDNFNGRGLEANSFMQKLFINSLIYGEYYVLIDKPKKPDNASIFKTKELNIYPYCKMISPIKVLDYSIDDKGEYNWILILEEYIENKDPFKPMEEIKQYRLITREEIYLYTSEGAILEGYPINNELKRVPIVKCMITDIDHDGVGESFLKDIAWINNQIYNLSSLRSEEFRNTCFPQMYGPVIKARKGEDEIEVKIGNTTYFPVYDEQQPPGFISPDTSTLEAKTQNIDNLISEILRLAGLQKDDGVMDSNQASGFSKAISFLDTNQSFSEKSRRLQDIEYQIWEFISLYAGLTSEITIDYPQEFDVLTKGEKIKIGLDLMTVSNSNTMNTNILMTLYEDNFSVTDDELEIIRKELSEEDEEIEENIETVNTKFNNDIKDDNKDNIPEIEQ